MSFGVCHLSLIPVRKEVSHRSELTTQLLFGELYSIVDEQNDWLSIRIAHDNYEGWIEKSQLFKISEQEYKHLNNSSHYLSNELVQVLNNNSRNSLHPILLGSKIYGDKGKLFYLNAEAYIFDGTVVLSNRKPDRNTIIENAYMYLHTPYVWGGRTPFGIDCSGLTQMAYLLSGINLLRDASQQMTQGETINMISDAKAGDLLFFDNQDDEISHVGILLPDSKIIHASGMVRIDNIDHLGIFNTETQAYSHKLRLIKKIV